MLKKQLGFLILILAIIISPLLIQAENINLNKEEKELRNKVSTTTASTTKEKNQARENKTRTIQAATNIAKKITRNIARTENIIDRLTNDDSIIAKLEAKGINTTAIKDKLNSAEILVSEAETDILTAKNIISSTATSSESSIKTKVVGVRKLFEQASSNLKLAITKIKEAHKMIREIPGLQGLEKNKIATSTPESE